VHRDRAVDGTAAGVAAGMWFLMLTVATRVKVAAFLMIGIVVIVYIGLRYADLGRFVGVRGYYVVRVELSDGGGIFTDAEVTYRGVPVGRVGAMSLTDTGVDVRLDINDSARAIPANVQAVVADRSAVGEQYVDLRPRTDSAPYLADGATIAQRDTTLPPQVQTVLGDLDSLASSVPLSSLTTVVDQLYAATAGQGENLGSLLDSGSRLTTAAAANLPQTKQLIEDGATVLGTQADESNAIRDFGANAELLAHQLDSADGDLNRLITVTPSAADQIAGLLHDTDPGLGTLLANLLTTSDVAVTRQAAITETLSDTPSVVAAGSSVINSGGVSFGMALTFFDPLPCTAGYGGTKVRNGLDTSAQPPLNTAAQCAASPGTGSEVRGSANAPSG
jgi:phospholipid/cholesterol/gamma-HCH transport system substrate-binding protein